MVFVSTPLHTYHFSSTHIMCISLRHLGSSLSREHLAERPRFVRSGPDGLTNYGRLRTSADVRIITTLAQAPAMCERRGRPRHPRKVQPAGLRPLVLRPALVDGRPRSPESEFARAQGVGPPGAARRRPPSPALRGCAEQRRRGQGGGESLGGVSGAGPFLVSCERICFFNDIGPLEAQRLAVPLSADCAHYGLAACLGEQRTKAAPETTRGSLLAPSRRLRAAGDRPGFCPKAREGAEGKSGS